MKANLEVDAPVVHHQKNDKENGERDCYKCKSEWSFPFFRNFHFLVLSI